MVVSQQILDALKQIGLNLYERKLWVALLSRGTSTAGELSSLAKVPHSRTYDVLESLAEKGFVMIQTSKPLKYVATTPNEALERVKKKIKEDTDITIERIAQFQKSSALKELERVFKKGFEMIEPGEMTGSLRGRNALHQQLETCFKNAKDNISILTTSKGLNDIQTIHSDILKKEIGRASCRERV
jgi:sugar-specific transcriptional regulator TrmB